MITIPSLCVACPGCVYNCDAWIVGVSQIVTNHPRGDDSVRFWPVTNTKFYWFLVAVLRANCFLVVVFRDTKKPLWRGNLYDMLIYPYSNLFPNVLFPTPVGPSSTILGWGSVSVVQPQEDGCLWFALILAQKEMMNNIILQSILTENLFFSGFPRTEQLCMNISCINQHKWEQGQTDPYQGWTLWQYFEKQKLGKTII